METLTGLLGSHVSSVHIQQLFDEYTAHQSPEANYVKSLDLLDMYLQAYEYELINQLDLSEFFSKVPNNLDESSSIDPQVKEWIRELMQLREKKTNILPKDSNLNTILRNYLNKK
jgi:putative hydrolase of HD superfamily